LTGVLHLNGLTCCFSRFFSVLVSSGCFECFFLAAFLFSHRFFLGFFGLFFELFFQLFFELFFGRLATGTLL